jgi:hypothetical protein
LIHCRDRDRVHLHPRELKEKVEATGAGCKRFDGALKGIGGCPMADGELWAIWIPSTIPYLKK